jgi:predicted GIY-YIG superfamily endonuclease
MNERPKRGTFEDREWVAKNKRTYSVYALTEPSGAVRYVGMSFDASGRLTNHIRDARAGHKHKCAQWVSGLLARGERPVMIILERGVMTKNLASEREHFWIMVMQRDGHELVNIANAKFHWPVTMGQAIARRNWPETENEYYEWAALDKSA